jgi:hypothetical protein
VEEALTAKADLNAFVFETSEDSYTLLLLACLNDHLDAVQRLLTTGSVGVNVGSKYQGMTPLYVAARAGNPFCVKMLLEYRAAVNLPCLDGKTPLFTAVSNGHAEVVALLIDSGAGSGVTFMGLTPVDAVKLMPDGDRRRNVFQALEGGRDDKDRPVWESQGTDLLIGNDRRSSTELEAWRQEEGLSETRRQEEGLSETRFESFLSAAPSERLSMSPSMTSPLNSPLNSPRATISPKASSSFYNPTVRGSQANVATRSSL